MREYRLFLVTVKLPKNPEHDPRNKVTGPCPVFGNPCTDVTGEHHTTWIRSRENVETIMDVARTMYGHVTRVEEYPWPTPSEESTNES